MKKKIFIICSCDLANSEVVLEPSIFAPESTIYVMPEKGSMIEHGRALYQAEKEANEWRRKYHRLLDGLNYWKWKAQEFGA